MYRCVVSVLARDPMAHSWLCRSLSIGWRCGGGQDFVKDFRTKEEAIAGRAALLATVNNEAIEVVASKIEAINVNI